MGLPEDMIGAIKIKDGLFIGDEFAAQVSNNLNKVSHTQKHLSNRSLSVCLTPNMSFQMSIFVALTMIGLGLHLNEQGVADNQLLGQIDIKLMGRSWSCLPHILLARCRKSSPF